MKLVRLYSNQAAIFPEIRFNAGLNVILARVKAPEDKDKSDHNTGKSTLSTFIDFMLLEAVGNTFPTRKRPDLFGHMVFFLEILLPDRSTHVTIRRAANADTKIALKRHVADVANIDFAGAGEEEWDHWNLPLERATELLNSWLAFDAIPATWDYRKGVTYFLRTQNDYRDVFRVEKFQRGADFYWKPYMADLLGLHGNLLSQKYEADRLADGGEQAVEVLARGSAYSVDDSDKLSAQIGLAEKSIQKKTAQLGEFSFHDMEMEVSEDLVTNVDTGLSKSEQEIYYLRRDLQTAKDGLATAFEFKVDDIRAVYEDCAVALPDALLRSYEDLLGFNRKLINERNKYLRQRIRSLESAIEKETERHKTLSEQRQRYMELFKNRESLARFKSLQAELVRSEESLRQLKSALARVEEMIALREESLKAKRDSERLAEEIKKQVQHPSQRYQSLRERFQTIANEFLNVPAVLFVKQNEKGNLDFYVEVQQRQGEGEFSSEAEGTTFKKLLCMAFDLAVLSEYASMRFYHFIYHDGALEGEDDRKKFALLKLVERFCNEFGIQYILSAIQHELPRDGNDQPHKFADGVVVRELHDDGDSGRLFRMPIF